VQLPLGWLLQFYFLTNSTGFTVSALIKIKAMVLFSGFD
jgi:hypothetical protein